MDNRFKVGDKVQVISVSTEPYHYYKVGDIFTIVEVDTFHPQSRMKYKGVTNESSAKLWLHNDDIVAYEEKTKMPAKYHVGQKVRLTESFGCFAKGDIAEITRVDEDDDNFPVMIRLRNGDRAWIRASRFEVVKPKYPVIVITTDGKETKARLIDGKKTVRQATAKCSDKDTFDFETGAKIAFDRLIGLETKPEKSRSEFKPGMVCKVVREAKNIFGTAIVQPGDFVEIKSIDGEHMMCHGFSRAEQRFTDNIGLKDDALEAIS